METASPEIASSVCDDVVPPQQPDVTVTESDRNVSDHPTGSSSTSPPPPPLTGGAASPILGAAASPEPARQPDEDGIHLAPNGAGGPGSPEKAAMGAAERRSSFVQMEGRARSRSVGEKQWTRVRAVMAWYTRLRRIKKEPDVVPNGEESSSTQTPAAAVPPASHNHPSSVEGRSRSAQRWMKLRTTVQLTSAITSTVAQSKKTSLKREDSFIARFSTRQIPEAQETFDATDEGGSSSGGNGGSGTCGGGLAHLGEKSGGVGGGPANGSGAPVKRRRRHQKPPRSVLNPDENGLFYWLAFLALWVLYNLWTIVVRLAFPELHHEDNLQTWNVCDALGDAAYMLDIAVQFRTGYLEQGIMVHDSRKLAIHYVRSKSFLIDMVSLLPIDWMLLPQQLADPVLARWRPACRFLRLIKLYRVFAFYYVVESRTVYPNAWRVVNLVHILLMLAHWFGCFYFLLSESEGFQSDWSYPYPEGDFATLTRKYLGSLYWSTLTLTTIGDLPTPETNADRPRKPNRPHGSVPSSTSRSPSGWSGNYSNVSRWNVEAGSGASVMSSHGYSANDDGLQALPRRGLKSRILHHSTNQGYIFTIASYLIGVFIFATIVGQVGNVITNRNASRLEFERLLDTAKLYMRHHKVPRSMQRRVQRWYDYSWSRGRIQGGGDTSSALRILPDKLKTELALHVNLATLKKVSIFKECQPEFLHDLVLKMRASIFTPGDMICRRGEVAREMFIIADGILEVISETGKVLTSMKAGDFFGEIGILNLDGLNKRTADVRSVGYAELFSLSREDVLSAMKDYPEAEEILLNLGRKRLIEARKMASQHRAQMARKGLLALERAAQLRAQQGQAANAGAASAGTDGTGQSATSRFTDRIRSDVFGLKKAIRKSFKERRPKSDSPTIEMGTYGGVGSTFSGGLSKASSVPLGNATLSRSGSCTKTNLLRRMANVTSDETQIIAHNSSSEDCRITKPLLQKPESPEVIGAGLPLFQRLKLLRQRELEKEKQQQLQQQQQQQQQQDGEQTKKEGEQEASQPTQEVAVTIETGRGESRSPPPLPGTSSQRDDKQPRHITFVDDEPSHKKRDYVPPDPPKPRGKSARWTLAVLPGRSGGTAAKIGRPKMLNTIIQASSSSSALDSLEQAEPPPAPPPLPPTPPFWQPKASSPLLRSGIPPPRPPAPHFPGLNIRGRKKPPRRALTMRPEDAPSSLEDSNVPYRPVQQFRSLMKQPWHRSGIEVNADSPPPPPPPPPPTSSSKSKFTRQMSSAGAAPPNRRFSRQNTIQVVSDVQGVLSDILRDIVPSSSSKTSNRTMTKPLINPEIPQSEPTSYGTMRAPIANPSTNWESVRQETLVSDRPPQRPQRLNLRQCKNRSSRDYNSIDDLSPEYTVLPFVKRLKILNERQKIVELQKALTTTTTSLSIASSRDVTGSATTSKNPSASTSPIPPAVDSDKGTVAESNETPERVCLKKMLKSASRKELIPKDQTQRIKLLRSQTVEGYAVRHANFTKLNHQRIRNNHRIAQTLPSPPSMPFYNQESQAVVDDPPPNEPTSSPLLADLGFKALVPDKRNLSLLKTEHEGVKEECVAELLTAIKTVLQERLDEIQARFQAQIQLLQTEVEQKDQLISQLQFQLTSLGVPPVLPVPADETQSDREEQTSSVDSDGEEDEDDDNHSRTLRYFARSFSKGSFIHLDTPSPSSPNQASTIGSHQKHSPCPSIDEMLDSAAEELPTAAILDPEPLWQLEFGSCWQRMHTSTPVITSNPRDLILDIEGSSFSSVSTSSDADQGPPSSTGSRLKKRTMSLDPSASRRQREASKATHGRSETLPAEGPYFPDWEIVMLAETLDTQVEDDRFACESETNAQASLRIPSATRRRRSFRSSASVDPQSISSAKSKKMIEKWYWSYPPPNQEEATEFPAKTDGGK